MNDLADSSKRYDANPDVAVDEIRSFGGSLLLDLDETLYLRNSTEDFLDTARPGLLALLLLRLLDVIQPWRWTGGSTTRDHWRVRLVAILMPWIWRSWRSRVAGLAADFGNRPLMKAIGDRTAPTLIVTVGFLPVVTPLVAALGLPNAIVVAARLNTFEDRRRGKLSMALSALGEEIVATSMVVTDSTTDLPLLDRCARPLRVVWPDAHYRKALGRVYLPGQYLTQVKRPGQRYLVHGILLEDFAFWVLCSIGLAPMPVTHVFGLLALLISFWAIYERGYVDNDWVAVHYEKDPKLSTTFGQVEVVTPRFQPWFWAAALGLVAIFLLRWPERAATTDAAAWAVVLLATHFGFKLYNRWDKSSRIWLFPGLQLARSASFTVLVPIGLASALALGAHVIARWVPYYLYRIGGKDWPEAPFFLTRLMFYVLLWLMLAITQDFDALLTPTALTLFLWNLLRARKELLEMITGIHRIDRQEPPSS